MPTGSFEFMFNRKAVFQLEKSANPTMDADELELELIDAGLEEIDQTDESVFLYADYTSFGELGKAIEEMGLQTHKSELQRIPTTFVEFTEEQLVDIEKLIDKIEDDEDILAVYTNIA